MIIWKKIICNNNEIKNLNSSNEDKKIIENISEHVKIKDKLLSNNQNNNNSSITAKPNKNKKRGPYKKHNKNDLENSLKYLEIKDSNGYYWKYSLSIFHSHTGTACYKCYDTS